MKKGFGLARTLIIVGIIAIFSVGGYFYSLYNNTKSVSVSNKNICAEIGDFIDYDWFENMENSYKKTYFPTLKNSYTTDDPEIFYADNSSACMTSDYLIFSPWENISFEGAFYSYNIKEDQMVKSPQNEEYLASGLTKIENDFVFFESAVGSGDCYSTRYGKYFYKENIIEIDKSCGKCIDSEEKCKELNEVYR